MKNYKKSKYYQCSKCGRLTPYNIRGKCIHDECTGTLSEVDPDEALATNYYRKQYKNKKIEPIVIKEHTAQLERKTAKSSQYITLNKHGDFLKNFYVVCPTCKRMNVFLSKTDNTTCRYCGQNIAAEIAQYYIEPVNGFKTGPTKESARLKPKRSYAGEVSYVGNGKTDEKRLVLGNVIGIETSSDDELLVMNKSGFYMCSTCGYSEIYKGALAAQQITKKHKNYRQYECSDEKLNYLHLGHKFQTDVARLTIPELSSEEDIGYPRALSFLYALLEGVSLAMDIERNDIDGILVLNLDWKSYDVLLYDNVPGGAGHVKRLLSKNAIMRSLEAALDKISQDCCDENTSCYNCLRNYYNQSYHNKLQRKLAIDVINRLLFDLNPAEEAFSNDHFSKYIEASIAKTQMKLTLGSDGRNPGSESSREIWEDLIEDCSEESEIDLITTVMEKCPDIISRPYYDKTVKIEETGEKFHADLLWDDKKTILFLDESYEDYLIAQKTGWNVFCTRDGFDVDAFIEKVVK